MRSHEKAIFANMCMIYDDNGNVLVQNRTNMKWSGIAFPGGHVEKGEDFSDAVIREIFEETGLTIQYPKLCGVKNWYEDDGSRYVVLCYKTNHFTGTLTSSAEGEVFWTKLDDMPNLKLSSGMEYMLQLFLDDNISEHCVSKENDQWINVLK